MNLGKVCIIAIASSNMVFAWDSVQELEADACCALTNAQYLTSEQYVASLRSCVTNSNLTISVDAQIMLALSARQRFWDTVDSSMTEVEMQYISNVVASVQLDRFDWRYWLSRLIYASVHADVDDYSQAYCVLTNSICSMPTPAIQFATNSLPRAILNKYELTGLSVEMSFKVLAGLSAAELGKGVEATNFANQVSAPYREMILRLIR